MPDPKKVYQYDPICTRAYDGLWCDGECKTCDEFAATQADDADYRAESYRDLLPPGGAL